MWIIKKNQKMNIKNYFNQQELIVFKEQIKIKKEEVLKKYKYNQIKNLMLVFIQNYNK